jgi:hypothetical protein
MHATSFLPGLSPVAGKSLTTARDAGNLSSNGGAVVLREAAHRLGLAQAIAGPLPDTRNPLLVTHTYANMVMARMVAIACGYEDADDLDTLRHDPALKIACDRAPESGAGLPSQPTISRLENRADTRALYRIGIGLIDLFCGGYAVPPPAITPDSVSSISTTPMTSSTAGSNSACSTRTPEATASSRSTSSKATPASPSCR